MSAQTIDYDALAKQAGAVSSQPARGANVDYDALAKQAGATKSEHADMMAPEGSAAGRAAGGFWQNTLGGLGDTGLAVLSLLRQAGGPGPVVIDPNSHAGQAITGIVQGHIDQAHKAKDALDRGEYTEAFGHTLATALPLIGPAAAHAAERMAGDQPVFDRYGRVVAPGHEPDIAGGLGEAGGLITSSVAPEIVKGVRQVLPESVRVTPRFASRLNPVKQAGVDFVQERGVPVRPAAATGNPVLKSAERYVANSPIGEQAAAEMQQATAEGLTRVGGELAERAHPTPVTPEMAGRAAAEGLGQSIQDLGAQANEGYGRAWQGRGDPEHTYKVPVRTVERTVLGEDGKPLDEKVTVPVMEDMNMPVDIRAFKAKALPRYEEMDWNLTPAEQFAAPGFNALKRLLASDNFVPAWKAEHALSGLKSMAEVTDPSGVRNVSQGIAAGLIPDLQEGIDRAVARTGDDALSGLQQGRAMHARKMEIVDVANKLRAEPVQAFKQMTSADDANIEYLRQIQKYAPDAPAQIGRALIGNLMDEASQEGDFSGAARVLRQYRRWGPETKAILFPDRALRSALDRFFTGADVASEQIKPGEIKYNPLRWAAGKIGGKMLFTPEGARAMTEGLRIPLGGLRGIAAQRALENAVRDQGGTPPPETPGPAAPPDSGGPPPPPGAPPAAAAAAPEPSTQNPPPAHDVPENPRQWMIDERQRQAAARQAFIDKTRAAGGQEAEQQQSATALEAVAAAQQARRQAFIDKWKAAGKTEEPVPPDLANRQADVGTVQAGATDGTTETEMDAGATGAVDAGGTREGAAVHAAAPASARYPSSQQTGHATDLLLPGEKRTIPARYEVRELSQITPSHNGQTFSANPQYANVNERDYSKPENQQRVITSSSEEGFQPRWHITDNPDAVNGPPVIDENGNAVAGNSRAMMLQRVYGRNSTAATAYRNLLEHQAAHYGIDPEVVRGMKQPVLVRTVSTADLEALPGGSKYAIRKTNIVGTADLSSAERAMADAGQLSPDLVTHIGNVIDRHGPDATLNDALTGTSGISIVNHLIDSGFFSEQQRASLMDQQTGAVTQLAKDRISKAFLGQFFRDSDQIARTPAAVKAKIERIAAPLAKLSDNPQFDIRQDIGNAIDAMEYKRAQGFSNYADAHQQGGMFGNQENPITPRSAYFAGLLEDFNPNDLVDITRNYAANSVPEHTMFGNYDPTPQQAMSDAVTSVIGEQEKTALKPIDKKMAEAKEKGVAETSPAWQSLQEKRDTTVAEFAEKQKVYQRKAQIGLQTATATTGESEASPEAQQAFVAKVKRARKPKKPAS